MRAELQAGNNKTTNYTNFPPLHASRYVVLAVMKAESIEQNGNSHFSLREPNFQQFGISSNIDVSHNP